MQLWLDAFEMRMTQQLVSIQTVDIMDVKAKVAEIIGMVYELYDRLIIPEPVVITVIPNINNVNIWDVLDPVEDIVEENQEKI